MAETDIRILDVRLSFQNEKFRTPLKLSSGPIHEVVYLSVEVEAVNRKGGWAVGVGGGFLSDLWAFPTDRVTPAVKGACMRELSAELGRTLGAMDGFADPLQINKKMESRLVSLLGKVRRGRELPVDIPYLAGLVCWSPFDAAVHDAWGLANGRSTYAMYTAECLNEDLSAYLGDEWKGMYPDSFLAPPKESLPVAHVVGVSDQLDARGKPPAPEDPQDGLPFSLRDWIIKDRVAWLKLKIKGTDTDWNAAFIRDTFRVASETAREIGIREPVRLSLDPNEACPSAEPLLELFQKLKAEDPAAYEAIKYVEQPTSRDLSSYSFTMHEVASLKPVIIDESLEGTEVLPLVERQGWNGVALKTCKGQSEAIVTYCWARRKGMFITVQDLTNTGMALVQSAHLAARLHLSAGGFEYNSRQYVPWSRGDDRERYPDVFTVRDGRIRLSGLKHEGLY